VAERLEGLGARSLEEVQLAGLLAGVFAGRVLVPLDLVREVQVDLDRFLLGIAIA